MLDYKQQARALKGTLTIFALVTITAAALAFNPGGFTFHGLVYGQDTPTIGNQTKVGPTPFKGQIIGTESAGYRYATSFQTANVRHRLDKAVIYISGIGNSNFLVEIWSNNEESNNQGRPGARLATLSDTSPLSNVLSAIEYTPSGTLYLEPHATYWLVTKSRPSFAEISLAIGDDEDTGGTQHWSIGDETIRARIATSPAPPGVWSQYQSNPIRMGIYSTPDPGDPVMISNLRQTFLKRDLQQGRIVGTSFTTGSDAKVLKRVRIFASREDESTSISASLWSHNDSNHPQTELASLTRVGRASTGHRNMIDFTSDQYLEPSSTYWVVVEFSGGAGSVVLASSDHHDPLAAANWQIGNNTARHVTGATWSQESPDSLKMQVFAGSAPHITRSEITSTPLDGDTYKAGENIEITYTFDVPVDYVQGVAAVYVGAATGQSSYRAAEYMGGSGSRQLLYRYRIKRGDADTNGVGLEANSLGANSAGNIVASDGKPAEYEHATRPTYTSHKVNGSQIGCARDYCADLSVVSLAGSTGRGSIYHDVDSIDGGLSNRAFSYGEHRYLVSQLLVRNPSRLELVLNQDPRQDLSAEGTLRIGERDFHLRDAMIDASEHRLVWENTGLDWSAISTVRVFLEDSVLVSNLGQSSDGSLSSSALISAIAQSFTTGSGADAFGIDSITLEAGQTGATLEVAIHSDNSGTPGSKLRGLTGPSIIDDQTGTAEVFSTSSYPLKASTTYWMVVSRNGSGSFSVTSTNAHAEDSGKAVGWAIGNSAYRLEGGIWSEVVISGASPVVRMSLVGRGFQQEPAMGSPHITGPPQVGQILTAHTSGITDANGLSGASFSYQWKRFTANALGTENIPSATNSTYILQSADDRRSLLVEISFTDDHGFAERLSSPSTGLVGSTVSNFVSTQIGGLAAVRIGAAGSGQRIVAQSFATGPGPNTYSLQAVDVAISNVDGEPDLQNAAVAIHADAGGNPGGRLYALVLSQTLRGLGVYSAPSGAVLNGSTTYWVVLSRNGMDEFNLSVSDVPDEDTGSPGGWSIGNQHRTADISSGADTSMANSFSWVDDPSGRVVRMGLKAVLNVTVQFGAANYTVSEGGTEDVSVTLSADPERMVVIPLTHTPRGGATAADYSGVPPSVTFNRGEMEQTFTFTAVQDTEYDDEDHVELGFGAPLGPGVSEGTPAKTSVNIADDENDPFVAVRFAQATYRVVEGERVTVRVALDADPERTVTIPIRKTNQYGATNDDYSGVPPNVTFNAGQTSATFEFMAVDDNSADAGESVRLTFGAMPDARVSEGSPNEAIVTIREASGEFILDCETAVWCADLGLADHSKVDWGWADLYYSGSTDPPSTLSQDTFTFRGTKYLVSRAGLKAGTYPMLPNDWSRERQHSTKFWIYVSAGFPGPVPSRDHYQDWVLHLGGITLPFKKAVSAGEFGFEWIEGDLQELYNDYTAATPFKIGIEEVAAADQPPILASPRLPREVEVWSEGRDQLTIHWMWPRWTHFSWERGIPDATGYLVQWKRASDSWGDAGKVSQREVAAREGKCCYYVRTTGQAQNTLYTARVIAFNAAGDGPSSDDALGRTQGHRAFQESRTVNGETLTMRYHDRLDQSRVPDPGAFVVLVDGGVRTVTSVEVSGRDVRLTLDPPVSAANSVLARYEDPGGPEAAALHDVNGNRVESVPENWWGMRTVANLTPPGNLPDLTATFSNLPAAHDGSTPFDFNVTFSEMVWIARGAPRYGMLTVEGGEVTSAHRLNRRSVLWEVTIQPETQGDIMVTLPVGNCSSENANGMPCAVGGRALASEVAAMIPGLDSMQQRVENTPAGGTPEITGNAQVGQTLKADTTGITDADGLQNVTFTYQWLADGSEIPGATNVTYTVDSDNVGKAIKVRVDFTDDTGNVESLTSAPTDTVTAAGLELQSATVNGATLTLTYSTNLDVSATPPISAFTVNVNDMERSIDAVGVGGTWVLLFLSSAVVSTDTVTVEYDKPSGANAIRDTGGNEAASFATQAVTNSTSAGGTGKSESVQAPGSLTVVRHTSGKLSASWEAPASGPDPTGYTVQWKKSVDSWATEADVSEANVKGTSHVIKDLTDGTAYSVRVVSRKGDDDSDPSAEMTATPQETVAPTPASAAVNGATLTITFSETLDTGHTPDKSAFAVSVAGSGRGVDTVSLSGSMATLTLATPVASGDAVTVDYTVPTGNSAVRLQDLAGNAAASFSGQSVTNNTVAAVRLTATASAVPGSHNGRDTFTFELRFSEEPKDGFSYKTMKNHAFTVSGGTVAKTNRLDPPSNTGWLVHITPGGNGAVTVVLPPTTDCESEGAICTNDARMLSQRLQVTVPGPGG